MRGHAFRSGGLSYPAIVCRLFRAGGFLLWGCCGVFSVPLEKTVIFLTAPEGQNSAALSGLSDEQMRLNTQKTIQPPAVALRGVQPRWRNSDLPGQLEIPRF